MRQGLKNFGVVHIGFWTKFSGGTPSSFCKIGRVRERYGNERKKPGQHGLPMSYLTSAIG